MDIQRANESSRPLLFLSLARHGIVETMERVSLPARLLSRRPTLFAIDCLRAVSGGDRVVEGRARRHDSHSGLAVQLGRGEDDCQSAVVLPGVAGLVQVQQGGAHHDRRRFGVGSTAIVHHQQCAAFLPN